MNRRRQVLFTENIGVIAISDTEWRVSDLTIDERDALSLIGFVQKLGDLYEITALGAPLSRSYVGTFNAAIGVLSSRAA